MGAHVVIVHLTSFIYSSFWQKLTFVIVLIKWMCTQAVTSLLIAPVVYWVTIIIMFASRRECIVITKKWVLYQISDYEHF